MLLWRVDPPLSPSRQSPDLDNHFSARSSWCVSLKSRCTSHLFVWPSKTRPNGSPRGWQQCRGSIRNQGGHVWLVPQGKWHRLLKKQRAREEHAHTQGSLHHCRATEVDYDCLIKRPTASHVAVVPLARYPHCLLHESRPS